MRRTQDVDPGWASSINHVEPGFSNDLLTEPSPLQGLCSNLLVTLRYKEDNLVQPEATTPTLLSTSIVSSSVRSSGWLFIYFYPLEMALDNVDELPPDVRGTPLRIYFNYNPPQSNLPTSVHSIQPSESDVVSLQSQDFLPRKHSLVQYYPYPQFII